MKTLAVAAVALMLVAAAPREAPAQESGTTAGAVAATIVGAAVGGAAGYYYVTGTAATLIGIVAGGAIGDWWYTVAMSRGSGTAGKMKMNYGDTPSPLFHLVGHPARSQAGLRTAAFSAQAD